MSDSAESEESPDANRELADEMYARFQAGESKSSLEIEFWDDGTSHGKRFTSFIRNQLGIETESKSKQTLELDHPSSLLSSFELASIVDLPSAEALPGLPRPRARSVAPPRDLPVEGKPLGISDRRRRPVAISVEDASHHLHVIGETGTGKSTLIARMVLADAAAGRGAVVIDPKGDLVGAIIDRLPESALGNTCLLDPEESEMAVGLNVLAGEDTDLVVDHIVSVFKRIYEGAWGPRSDDIMRAACRSNWRIRQTRGRRESWRSGQRGWHALRNVWRQGSPHGSANIDQERRVSASAACVWRAA